MNIPVTEMKDGQVGIITTWTISSYVGRIVQRHGSDLIAIGLPEKYSWPFGFDNWKDNSPGKIQIISPGRTIRIPRPRDFENVLSEVAEIIAGTISLEESIVKESIAERAVQIANLAPNSILAQNWVREYLETFPVDKLFK